MNPYLAPKIAFATAFAAAFFRALGNSSLLIAALALAAVVKALNRPLPCLGNLLRPSSGSLLGLLLLFSAPLQSAGIISINLCSDLLLYDLADRDQIQSLSYFAKDRHYSPIVDKINQIPINSGRIEQIIAARPSLVLASAYSSALVLDMLRRFNIKTYPLLSVQSLAELYAAMRGLGAQIGQSQRAQERITALQLALKKAATPIAQPTQLGAIYLSPNGYSAGHGTLTHQLITLAGYTNLTAALGAWHTVSLEQIIALKPDVIITAQGSEHYDRAHEWLSHPAIQAVPAHVVIPAAYWSCPSSHLTLAYQILQDRRTQILNSNARLLTK